MLSPLYNHFPEHADLFIDTFAGSGVAGLNAPIPTVILNDLNPTIYNLHLTVKQENPFLLATLLEELEISEEEFNRQQAILDSHQATPIDKAVAALYIYNNSFNAAGKQFANRHQDHISLSIGDSLLAAHQRLKHATILNEPALDIVAQYKDFPKALLYLDPPYLDQTREAKRVYKCEMSEPAAHAELLKAIIDSKAKILLSGYESELYDSLLLPNGFNKHLLLTTFKASSPNQKKPEAREFIYKNY